jgi:hypothetical protein
MRLKDERDLTRIAEGETSRVNSQTTIDESSRQNEGPKPMDEKLYLYDGRLVWPLLAGFSAKSAVTTDQRAPLPTTYILPV